MDFYEVTCIHCMSSRNMALYAAMKLNFKTNTTAASIDRPSD